MLIQWVFLVVVATQSLHAFMPPVSHQSNDSHAIILDSVNDGVFTVDDQWRITSFNRAAERITGVKRQQAIGKPCCEVFRASICETACALRKTLATGRPVVNKAVYILDAKGNRIPISISTAVFKDADGKTIGGVETFRDLTLVEDLRKELEAQYSFAEIVGRSAAMRQVFQLLPQIAESDSTVLIEGASGTGKELFARAIHNLSRRRKKRFVASELCGAAGYASGIGIIWLQGRGIHRCPAGQTRSFCSCRRRHVAAGRNRRYFAGHAGPIAPGFAGASL